MPTNTPDDFDSPAGSANPASSSVSKRAFLRYAGATLALLVAPVGFAAQASLLAVRIWPSRDYTRITLESKSALSYSHLLVPNPDRLVLDLEGIELSNVLSKLPGQATENDPYIQGIRAGVNRPGVIRIVIDLKQEVDPQLFTLQPVGNYGHRLVVDLFPTDPVDPLLAWIQKSSPEAAARGDLQAGDQVAVPGQEATPASVRPQPEAPRMLTIVIDAGHGGEDPGAIGRGGTYEKTITLAVARRLHRKINAEPGMRAVMTRDGDYFVPLRQRVARARRAQADLFVSVHADAFVRPEARGSSVYVLSENGATSTAASWLAQRENDADLIGGVNLGTKDGHLARTLLDLSQTATINDSLKLGKAVLQEIGGINRLHKPKVEQAGFAVLRAPDIPSILVETAFISNPEEERRLRDTAYQDRMADAILRGVKRYFAKSPPVARTTVAKAN